MATRTATLMTHEEAEQAWSKTLGALDTDSRIVEQILLTAWNHDAVAQKVYTRVHAGLDKLNAPTDLIDDLGTLCFTIIAMCAGLGEGALGRARDAKWYRDAIVDSHVICELDGDALRDFLQPLFADAGLADHFEVRTNHAIGAYINSRDRRAKAA